MGWYQRVPLISYQVRYDSNVVCCSKISISGIKHQHNLKEEMNRRWSFETNNYNFPFLISDIIRSNSVILYWNENVMYIMKTSVYNDICFTTNVRSKETTLLELNTLRLFHVNVIDAVEDNKWTEREGKMPFFSPPVFLLSTTIRSHNSAG